MRKVQYCISPYCSALWLVKLCGKVSAHEMSIYTHIYTLKIGKSIGILRVFYGYYRIRSIKKKKCQKKEKDTIHYIEMYII